MDGSPQHLLELIAEQLDGNGIAVVDSILPKSVLEQLLNEATVLSRQGGFQPANIGRGMAEQRVNEVRGDGIHWLEKETLTTAQQHYFDFLESLREHLSSYFRIALPWFECHLAAYPEGSFYARHLDQFRDANSRIFSVILYLNPVWKAEHGGQLRIYDPNGSYDIQPEMGKFVCFRSDLMEHEVLRTDRTRFSITGWLRRDELKLIFD